MGRRADGVQWGSPHEMGLRKLGLLSLEEYFRSPVWRRRRRTWKGAWRCFVCGSEANLVLHHRSYLRLGEELDSDLICLCADHHREVHRIQRLRPRVCRGLSDAHLYVATRFKAVGV